MSCRLASASSGMLHSVVNHCPSPPLYPGGLPLSLSAGLKALFLVGTESELRDIQYFTTSLLSGMLCQTFSYVFWIIYIYIYITFRRQKQCRRIQGKKKEVRGKCDSNVREWHGGLLKTFFYRKGTTSCSLAFDRWDWKIGHTRSVPFPLRNHEQLKNYSRSISSTLSMAWFAVVSSKRRTLL